MKVLVIGDSCVDIFTYGSVPRLCPEAPVPIFVPSYSNEMGGMAKNVLNNIISLGIECDLITQNVYVEKKRCVDEKTNQIILRIDSTNEKTDRINFDSLVDIKKYDAVVISDYDKGFVTYEDIQNISRLHPLTFLDTKKILGDWCKDITYIKINKHEYKDSKFFIENNDWLLSKVITTLEDKGASHINKIYPVQKVEVKDMSGAGDTFLSGLVVKYLESKNIEDSIEFANKCATQVVQKKGVSVVKF